MASPIGLSDVVGLLVFVLQAVEKLKRHPELVDKLKDLEIKLKIAQIDWKDMATTFERGSEREQLWQERIMLNLRRVQELLTNTSKELDAGRQKGGLFNKAKFVFDVNLMNSRLQEADERVSKISADLQTSISSAKREPAKVIKDHPMVMGALEAQFEKAQRLFDTRPRDLAAQAALGMGVVGAVALVFPPALMAAGAVAGFSIREKEERVETYWFIKRLMRTYMYYSITLLPFDQPSFQVDINVKVRALYDMLTTMNNGNWTEESLAMERDKLSDPGSEQRMRAQRDLQTYVDARLLETQLKRAAYDDET